MSNNLTLAQQLQSLVSHSIIILFLLNIHSRGFYKNPFCAAESAIAIQMEKMRAAEAIAARDVIAHHLSLACKSIRDKSSIIDALRQEKRRLEDIIKEHTLPSHTPCGSQSEQLPSTDQEATCTRQKDEKLKAKSILSKEKLSARHAILAALPLPAGIPSDALRPILIPSPYTLHEFLANAVGVSSLENYCVFQQLTTNWCPEREEHGYYLTPLFKCSTNPRVATAHRWMMVDVISKLDKPAAECFYNKDGKWYYAGVYKTIRLEDLKSREFEQLSNEASTIQALVKETLTGRKNVSPQTVYETTQLYFAGALKIACVGLQCIGFNDLLYRTILEQAEKCAQTGRWRSPFSFDPCLNSDAGFTPRLFSLPGTLVDRSGEGNNVSTGVGEFCKTR
ncbi:hypothetical protein B0F90DRAFT_1622036 [Multifurca ochricompacta]|uniref:DUF6697 domain-containing protein n=1 Tax=Multifurca ochricompacta TaxID=376703 RepID=A0AAD4MC82_9AGAM|nr:hypothetical protein B0F90DRAFT_1622036 [Multifurca ochricompacta]